MASRPLQPAVVLGDLNLIRCLGRAGVPVALASPEPLVSAARSRYCSRVLAVPPLEQASAAVEALMAPSWPQGTQPSLFYQTDAGLLAVSRHRERLRQRYRFVLPPAEMVEDLVDKTRFLQLALRLDLPIPRTRIVQAGPSALRQLGEWSGWPCVVKPALHSPAWEALLTGDGSWARKATQVDGPEEMARVAPRLATYGGDLILQELIGGGEDRIVSFHAYVRENGQVAAWFTGRKVRTYPRDFGVSCYVRITEDARTRALGMELLDRLPGFHGVLKMDFKEDPRDGTLYLLEINPRFNLWHYPAAVAGANLPALVYSDIHGLDMGLGTRARAGMHWLWLGGDIRAMQQHRRAGELTLSGWLRSLMAPKVYQPFAWDDPMPLLAAPWVAMQRKLRERIPGRPAAGKKP